MKHKRTYLIAALLLAAVFVAASLAGCGHKHSLVDGVCTDCGEACVHTYTDGVCTTCGIVCEHSYYAGKCTTCDIDYSYEVHVAEDLPKINIVTADGKNDWATQNMNFDMNNLNSKNNRPYHDCNITVSGCDEEYALDSVKAQVKIRGNYTANYPKKPFRIKFEKKQKMLGLNGGAKCKSWVLLADWKDMTLERNSLAFWLGKQILGSDGLYSTDFRQVEVSLNGQYWGVYLLAEQQQVNENRVDITEPEDGYKGTDIGYMIEYDGYWLFESPAERFFCNYNNKATLKKRDGGNIWYDDRVGFAIKNDVYYDDENNCAQTKFIESYMNNLFKLCYEAVYNHKYYTFNADRTRLVTYAPVTNDPVKETVSEVVDIRSLVDTYIINEIACDADIAWSSFPMDVDLSANGDKLLRFEAPWDFDSALGLKDSCKSGEGIFAAVSNNPWLILFINEDWFWNAVKEKWSELKATNMATRAVQFVNNTATTNGDEYQRNFDKWGFHIDGEVNNEANKVKNHAESVTYLTNWLNKRFSYLNTLWA